MRLSNLFPRTLDRLAWLKALRSLRRMGTPPVTHTEAAISLVYLNRIAKIGRDQRRIYNLKTSVLAAFLHRGHRPTVSVERQTLKCYTCNGTGWFTVEHECRRCGGTGVYATHHLLRLTYRIGGFPYTWHQPFEKAAEIGVQAPANSPIDEYQAEPRPAVDYHPETVRFNLARLVVYLANPYDDFPPALTLAEAEYLAGYRLGLARCLGLDVWYGWVNLVRRIGWRRRWLITICPDCHRPEVWLGQRVGEHSECFPF